MKSRSSKTHGRMKKARRFDTSAVDGGDSSQDTVAHQYVRGEGNIVCFPTCQGCLKPIKVVKNIAKDEETGKLHFLVREGRYFHNDECWNGFTKRHSTLDENMDPVLKDAAKEACLPPPMKILPELVGQLLFVAGGIKAFLLDMNVTRMMQMVERKDLANIGRLHFVVLLPRTPDRLERLVKSDSSKEIAGWNLNVKIFLLKNPITNPDLKMSCKKDGVDYDAYEPHSMVRFAFLDSDMEALLRKETIAAMLKKRSKKNRQKVKKPKAVKKEMRKRLEQIFTGSLTDTKVVLFDLPVVACLRCGPIVEFLEKAYTSIHKEKINYDDHPNVSYLRYVAVSDEIERQRLEAEKEEKEEKEEKKGDKQDEAPLVEEVKEDKEAPLVEEVKEDISTSKEQKLVDESRSCNSGK
jgi:hypothetical protein